MTIRSKKAIAEENVKVGGAITTVDGLTARFIEIGRKGEVRGLIKAGQIIIGKEARVESVYGRKILLRSGAYAENIYGESIAIESNCQISGEVQYTIELRTGEHVSFAKAPQKVEKLRL